MTGEKVSEVMHPILGASDAISSSNDGIYNYLCYYPQQPEVQPTEPPTSHVFILLSGLNGLL